jgi:hypothetical protein
LEIGNPITLRACLEELHSNFLTPIHKLPNTSSFRNFGSGNSRKNLELGANSIFFMELLKGCSKNTSYRYSHGVRIKLPTIATSYTRYLFLKKNPSVLLPAPPFFFVGTRRHPYPVNPSARSSRETTTPQSIFSDQS